MIFRTQFDRTTEDFESKNVQKTKEFGQKYRYFEIVACYGIDYESEECDDEYSHYVRIPKRDADDIWDRPPISSVEMDYLAQLSRCYISIMIFCSPTNENSCHFSTIVRPNTH